jgi:Tol biopolymer transport system component
MSTPDGFDRLITTWLDELAPMREPDGLLETVTGQIQRTRRLPGWALLERWLPMQTRAKFGAIPRTAIILVTLGILALILTAVAIGAQPSQRLAPLFGPAGNGRIFSIENDDIYVADPGSDVVPQPFDVTPGKEKAPTVTNDGSRVIYERTDGGASSPSTFMIAAADGTDVPRAITSRTFASVRDWWPSPDGTLVAVVSPEGASENLTLIRTDGSGTRSVLLGLVATTATWSPDGHHLMITAQDATTTKVYVVDINGGPPTLIRSGGKDDFAWLTYSPDGKRIAYDLAAPDQRPGKVMRVFVADADGTGEQMVEVSPDSDSEAGGFWSPDGTLLVVNVGRGNPHTLAIVPVDGGGPAVMSEGFYGTSGLYMVWAPDGRSVLAWRETGGGVASVDATTGTTTMLPWTSTDWPNWQRVAP